MSDESTYVRSHELASRFHSKLLVVDVQESLIGMIPGYERIVSNIVRLVEGCRALDVPVFATEQYPKGLGGTTPAVLAALDGVEIPEKLRFSSAECLGWSAAGEEPDGRDTVVVVGIEAHVCISQTVHDLLAAGYGVHAVADAIGSRHAEDRDLAIARFRDAGATVTSTEAVLFELCEVAGTPDFKTISRLIKESDAERRGGGGKVEGRRLKVEG